MLVQIRALCAFVHCDWRMALMSLRQVLELGRFRTGILVSGGYKHGPHRFREFRRSG